LESGEDDSASESYLQNSKTSRGSHLTQNYTFLSKFEFYLVTQSLKFERKPAFWYFFGLLKSYCEIFKQFFVGNFTASHYLEKRILNIGKSFSITFSLKKETGKN
jgi:hypothetical protein